MHPILTHKGRLRLYLIAWGLLGGLLSLLLKLAKGSSWAEAFLLVLPTTLVYAFMCLAAWYLCRAFPLERTGFMQLLTLHLAAAFLSSGLWIAIAFGWMSVCSRLSFFQAGKVWSINQILVLFVIGTFLFLLSVSIHYLISTFESARGAERQALELKILSRDMELNALRAQIHPHFLFNSLNSISALATADPLAARRMCLLLADFLRMSLKLGSEASISLNEELAMVENFLAIEQVRFGPRLTNEMKISEDTRAWLVPALLLQPLLENAVNHGIAHLLDGGTIRLSTEYRGERLYLTVENPCDPDRPAGRGQGIGLENVRKRLRNLYGTEARMDIRNEAKRFEVQLVLPAHPDRNRSSREEESHGRHKIHRHSASHSD